MLLPICFLKESGTNLLRECAKLERQAPDNHFFPLLLIFSYFFTFILKRQIPKPELCILFSTFRAPLRWFSIKNLNSILSCPFLKCLTHLSLSNFRVYHYVRLFVHLMQFVSYLCLYASLFVI